jgi:DNA polymerase III subunit gamma/tau
MQLLVDVENYLRLGRYAPGRIEFTPADRAPADLASRLGARLQSWTGVRWGVSLVNDAFAPTIVEVRNQTQQALFEDVRQHPLVAAIFQAFPGAKITEVRDTAALAAAAVAALPEVSEEWDPFEDD